MYVRTRGGLGLGLVPYEGPPSSYLGDPKPLPKVECPQYEKGEVERSHCQEGPCQQGHLLADVIRHPRGLLIADFGVGWSGIKAATKKEKLLQDWMGEAKTNLYSIILRIYGYSDCVGAEKNNVALRRARAERVYGLLDKALQSRVDFMGAARTGEYVADNKTKEGRANNRGVIIELFRLREEIIDITDTRCLRPNCPPPPPPPKRCIPPDCPPPPPPPPPPKPPDIDPGWRPPRIPFPGLSPKEILDRAREVLEYLKRNGGDQGLIKKLEGLLFEAGKIATFAGAVFGLYIFAKGKLVQVAVATGMGLLPRILHRFETSGMKEALERILNELTDPKTTEPIKQEIRRTQPRAPKSALTECQERNPTFPICQEQFDIGPEKIVMNFLKNERIDSNDVLGINCRKFKSFGPGVIDDCNHAPGETWHCTVTTKVPGSPKPYVRVVSLFRCLCCRADGWPAHDWKGPHWSAG
jgi:hypothetical protein